MLLWALMGICPLDLTETGPLEWIVICPPTIGLDPTTSRVSSVWCGTVLLLALCPHDNQNPWLGLHIKTGFDQHGWATEFQPCRLFYPYLVMNNLELKFVNVLLFFQNCICKKSVAVHVYCFSSLIKLFTNKECLVSGCHMTKYK